MVQKLPNGVVLMFLLGDASQESFYYLKKKSFYLLFTVTFNPKFRLEAGLWRLCVSPSWLSTLKELKREGEATVPGASSFVNTPFAGLKTPLVWVLQT